MSVKRKQRSFDNAEFPPAGPRKLIFVCVPDPKKKVN